MVSIDQSQLKGKTRDRPISKELKSVLEKAGEAAGIDTICVYSGGQPGTSGKTTGSTRHNGGRAADLYLITNGKTLSFTDKNAPANIKKFITACAAFGATGMGAGVNYMGKSNLHIGFGKRSNDQEKVLWGAKGKSINAPQWLRDAAKEGWFNPPNWVFQTDSDQPEDLPETEDKIFDADDDAYASITDIPERFNYEVIVGAQACQRSWGIPASITLAQWALESGYGSSMPPGSNNPFGIKAREGEPFVSAWTTEFVNGEKVRVKEAFRIFPDMASAFIRHSKLLATAGVYAPARKFLSDPDSFADALTGVYATDPEYGSKLKSIMKTNGLQRFDLKALESGTLVQVYNDEARIAELQQQLTNLGFYPGAVDGKSGPQTTRALIAFQTENGIPITGIFDDNSLDALGAVKNNDQVTDGYGEKTLLPAFLALIEILEKKKKGPEMTIESSSEEEIIKSLLEKLGATTTQKQKDVGPVNGWLGQTLGKLLNGRKTGLGIIGLLGTVLLPGLFPSVFGPLVDLFTLEGADGKGALEGQSLLQWIFGLITTWGVAGKVEKSGK